MSATERLTPRDEEVARFERLTVEGFALDARGGSSRHFERNRDLLHLDVLGSGTREVALLITLGIDGSDCHKVELDYLPRRCDDGAHDVVREAIATLEVILQQLEVMESTPDARKSDRNAFELGIEAEREGFVKGTEPGPDNASRIRPGTKDAGAGFVVEAAPPKGRGGRGDCRSS